HVLEEFPQQPRLAGAGFAGHGDETSCAAGSAVFGDLDDRLQLTLTPDQRCFEAGTAAGSADTGHYAQRRPGMDRLIATLHLVQAGVLVVDRGFARPAGDVVHEDGAG